MDAEKEFIGLVRANERIIFKVCSFYISPQASIEDLYQETIINLWRSYPKFRHESKVSTWIYRIALNTCITNVRKEKRRPPTVPIQYVTDEADPDVDDKMAELYALINTLGNMDKVVVLLYLEERPYQEISEITGLSVSNVGVRLNRIKNKLKTKL